MESNNVDM